MKNYKKGVFLFRRDLRVDDNTGLIESSKFSEEIIPCFILDPTLLKNTGSRFSSFRLGFLHECLLDLDAQLRTHKSYLHFFYGSPSKIVQDLIEIGNIDGVFANTDYTPFSKKRDINIQKTCKDKADFVSYHDLLLHDIELIKTQKGSPYKVFSQFFSKARELPIKKPRRFTSSNLSKQKINFEISQIKVKRYFECSKNKIPLKGGRTNCLKLLQNLKNLERYEMERNFPAIDGTSMMSRHNRFGTCSIREFYYKIMQELGIGHPLIAQIHWRDFFTYIMYHFPKSFNKEFQSRYEKIPWSKNKKSFSKWCEGKTGFPIVDSGMRELNNTGYMHNRVRMIVASFLTKDLHIDWRWGEKYFASKLVDYDPSVNIGNWQWSASTGCDAQPWFRIFNPWLQQKKFDPDCVYIKKWIPELKDATSKQIHNHYLENSLLDYHKPMVDHKEESSFSKEIFKKF